MSESAPDDLGHDAGAEADSVPDAALDELDESVSVVRERDEYLEALQRVQAEFENFRKRTVKQQGEQVDRAVGALVEKLLPVLDTFDLAVAHGVEGVEKVQDSLLSVLSAEGLERVHPVAEPFDPTLHDAVAHEEGEGGPTVVEVMRTGYRWRSSVLRPAMVKVRG